VIESPNHDGDYYDAVVIRVRVVGTAFPNDRVEDVPESTVSYDVQVLEENLKGIFTSLEPVNRVARGVKINSAAVGTPCKLFVGPLTVRLYLSGEEVPFSLCAPPEQPLLR